MSDIFSKEAADDRTMAPSREKIEAIESISDLEDELCRAEDACISIETQLEFFPSADDPQKLRGRRVTALIYWRIAKKNLENRIDGFQE